MSKTVKKSVKVMMVGLVAMLGAKAEAHWVNAGGRCVWHSFECSRMDTNRPPPPDPTNPLPFVELVATPIHGQVLCPGSPPKDIGLTEPMRTRRTQLSLSDITQVQDPVSGDAIATSEWHRIISDAFFWEACGPNIIPLAVIVDEWRSVAMNLYLNNSVNQPHSYWKAEKCTIQLAFDHPRGALYKCEGISNCHDDPGPQNCGR